MFDDDEKRNNNNKNNLILSFDERSLSWGRGSLDSQDRCRFAFLCLGGADDFLPSIGKEFHVVPFVDLSSHQLQHGQIETDGVLSHRTCISLFSPSSHDSLGVVPLCSNNAFAIVRPERNTDGTKWKHRDESYERRNIIEERRWRDDWLDEEHRAFHAEFWRLKSIEVLDQQS